jgi:hypothetical protein
MPQGRGRTGELAVLNDTSPSKAVQSRQYSQMLSHGDVEKLYLLLLLLDE